MELLKAHRQWSTRPADQRFWSLADLHEACAGYKAHATATICPFPALEVLSDAGEGDLLLTSPTFAAAPMTHWAFGQLCSRVGAPASYLRDLPSDLAAACLTHHLQVHEATRQASVLLHQNGSYAVRSVMSDFYSRVWNADITERLLDLGETWQVPPARPVSPDQPGARPATEADVLRLQRPGLSVQVGDPIAPAGLYASDHDIFVFLVDETRRINDGTDGGLARGFFLWNSEVGSASFGIMTFMYRFVCGNHIVWGAQQVNEIRVIHVGDANDKAFGKIEVQIREYAESSASDEEAKIKVAKRYQLGKTKEDVLAKIMGLRIGGLTTKRIGNAYDLVDSHDGRDGSPRTAWGMAQGLTELSQEIPYMDERIAVEKSAGRLLALATA